MAAAAVAAPEVLRECGCKGIRTCLICERQRGGDQPWQHQKTHRFIYYADTGWAVGAEESDFEGWAFPFPGVTLIEDFVTPAEEAEMVRLMDRDPWKLSQSGRRKQDYGPKVNFRKQKLKTAGFRGLPSFSREVVRRMGLYPVLEDFRPVEQCNLDYCPERGSAIDPHLDDTWLWGERLLKKISFREHLKSTEEAREALGRAVITPWMPRTSEPTGMMKTLSSVWWGERHKLCPLRGSVSPSCIQ
uniref:Alpha-ketoglutarate-dependent dioxygenase alkB homolog 4 isoform X2 n=1 Tax=Tursiops truncatus TaxID=9739 RepID=A0A6J3Q3X0_TURTR|nr:alpha-ketoglutarate-dependent dioxygenase alkB homolog 4 isoform X2 [Tursiops truncatus]